MDLLFSHFYFFMMFYFVPMPFSHPPPPPQPFFFLRMVALFHSFDLNWKNQKVMVEEHTCEE
jgi:hypothetical protein